MTQIAKPPVAREALGGAGDRTFWTPCNYDTPSRHSKAGRGNYDLSTLGCASGSTDRPSLFRQQAEPKLLEVSPCLLTLKDINQKVPVSSQFVGKIDINF
jgi:hypothetical protein